MILFASLTLFAVLSKLLGAQVYTLLSLGLAAALFFARYVVQPTYRTHIESFLLAFGVLGYALANRNPNYYEQAALIFCVIPSLPHLKAIAHLAKTECTCLLILAYMIWSCIWTSNLSMTLSGIAMTLVCLVFMFGYVTTYQGQLPQLLHHLMMIMGVLIVSSLIVGSMGHGFVGRTFAGVTYHRNQFGFLLGIFLLAGLFTWRQLAGPHVIIRAITLISALALFIYTDSKSAIIAFVVTLGVWFIARSTYWRLWLGIAALATIVFVISLPSPKMDHFALRMGRDPTFTSRTGIWGDSLKLLAEQPFTGFGYNATWSAFENRLSQYPEAPGPKYAHAFNGLIEWGLHLGLGGMLLYLAFLGTLLLRAYRGAHTADGHTNGVHALSLLVYVEIYNLANVSNMPVNRFGFFVLAVTTTCLFLTQYNAPRLHPTPLPQPSREVAEALSVA